MKRLLTNTITNKLTKVFTNNIQYKVLSILIALTIWYIVQGDEILEISRRVDVAIEVPQGYAVREGDYVSRDVTLRGPRVALSNFSSKPIQASIRLNVAKKGLQRFRVDKEMIARWDNRIKMTVHDPYVTVFVDEKASKSLPIKVLLTGSPKSGLSVLETKVEPNEITVTGLKSDIQKISEVTTEFIDISGVSESKSFPVPLSLNGLSDYTVSKDQVVVHVTMSQGSASKTFENIPIEILNTDKVSAVRPDHVSVVVQGPSEIVTKITSKELSASVDAKDMTPGRYSKRVVVKTPPGIVVNAVTPTEVRLEVYNQKKI